MLGVAAGLAYSAMAQDRSGAAGSTTAAAPTALQRTAIQQPAAANPDAAEQREMRLEGEKRFRTNCGRCHQAPHKFPPRVMAAVIRHMRVRATITDEDMRLILRYMTR
jgi:mono/diheme cytochrome c family protein